MTGPRKPRPKFLGSAEEHSIEHAEETENTIHEDELVGTSAHGSTPDLRAEEPFGETRGSTES